MVNISKNQEADLKKLATVLPDLTEEKLLEILANCSFDEFQEDIMTIQDNDELSTAIHELAEDLHRHGAIDKKTMHEFDESCLSPVPCLTPAEIRNIREQECVSQSVFARYLNISKNLVSDWERGVRKPGGPALRLLTLVRDKGLKAIA